MPDAAPPADRPVVQPLVAFAVRSLSVVVGACGVILLLGGVILALNRGSLYYLLAGLGLVGTAWLLLKLRNAGVALFGATFLATLIWALWEVGLNGWALVPRLVGPAILMFLVLLAGVGIAGTSRSLRRVYGLGALVFVLGAVVFGFAVYLLGGPPRAGAMPGVELSMSDPSAASPGSDWPAYGGSDAARRYSPLTQITTRNVERLRRVWTFHTRDLPDMRTRDLYGAETTPLKVGDTVYLCTPKSLAIAIDAASGRERWRYDPKVGDDWVPYTAACRGVAYYAAPNSSQSTPCATRIIWGTLDARLIAVDARTGQPCQDFGRNGKVDIKQGMGSVYPGMVSITSAPTIVRGVVVTGHQVLDNENRLAPSGVILGYDAQSGVLKWAWDVARPDLTSLPTGADTFTRGTPNSWTTASGDEALGLVYVPMGNTAGDYWSSSRGAEERNVSSALVALDVTTGKPVWTFQAVHMDVWDYDLGSQATLVDFPTPSGPVPALILPGKQGDLYVLDRRTGRPLSRVEERPVPSGGAEPQMRSPTQPFSLYHTLRQPDLRESDMWGLSPIDQMICRIQFRTAAYQGPYTPPDAGKRTLEYPGYNGGSDWGGVSVDPVRGVIVANYNDMPNYVRLVPRAVADRLGWRARSERGLSGKNRLPAGWVGDAGPQAGDPFAVQVDAGWRLPFTKLLCKQPPYGGIRAIDLATGRTIWDRPLGTARRNGPFGIASGLPFDIGTPNNGGSIVTAGGVVFIAATSDDLIRAIDLRTGRTLWQDKLPGGGQATPMTYEVGGRQYLLIMAGGHHFMETPVSDALVAYALP